MVMRVLVIGGTRFIGRAIVEELLHREHAVTVYHRGQHEVEFAHPVEHVHGDRRDYARFRSHLANLSCDAVVDVIAMNADDTRALVAALRGRIRCSVHISSGDVYDPGQLVPIPENAVVRSADTAEITAYGQTVPYSKVAVEEVIREAQQAGGFPATVLRLPAVYGPRDPLAREWFLVKRVLDGRPRIAVPDGGLSLFHRGYVDDVARAVALALENPHAVGRTYNVGHEQLLTVRGIAELVARVMDHEWEIVPVPGNQLPATNPFATPYHIVYDLKRIRAELGYQESVSLQEGMRRTVSWLLANPPTPETWGLARYLGHDAFDYPTEDAAIAAASGAEEG
ncbi:MAG: NAD-dependent epimerase/dehydratase family protein [Anaerolineales bacterium]|nr:MAG: NAD-dependent epimerase/dehydratase family protein [Anaerolineales bacterium]